MFDNDRILVESRFGRRVTQNGRRFPVWSSKDESDNRSEGEKQDFHRWAVYESIILFLAFDERFSEGFLRNK